MVLTVSPTLMDRYITVAGKISRMATGQASRKVITTDNKVPKDLFDNGFGVAAYNERASDALGASRAPAILQKRGSSRQHFTATFET